MKMPADICCFSYSLPDLSFLETSKENFNNVPDLELNPIRSKIVRAFFDNREEPLTLVPQGCGTLDQALSLPESHWKLGVLLMGRTCFGCPWRCRAILCSLWGKA
ncbi:hypothetical protein P7K49_020370 [Saguinus oedipus]|uniref:Uncharacterized protein n=1 Tax=Saguinus oedipus TaxID=9490 RepID=A0ABQ9V037_SAGOE|nr:hypothetical protein P7K49_020370 [Saguinus oedipus]